MSDGYEFFEFMQRWPDTRRSMVEKLHGRVSPEAARCWAEFVHAYADPMQAHLRRFLRKRGRGAAARDEAEELVQAFVARRLEDGLLARQRPEIPFRVAVARLLTIFAIDAYRKQDGRIPPAWEGLSPSKEQDDTDANAGKDGLSAWDLESMRHIVQSALVKLARGRNAGVYWLVIRAIASRHPAAHPALCKMLDMDWDVYGRRRLRACEKFAGHLMAGLGEGVGSEESWPTERETLDLYLKLHLPEHFPPHDPEKPDFPPEAGNAGGSS